MAFSVVNVRHRLTEDQTGGACYIFESEMAPGRGNKLHVHHYEDEVGYVLEGALEIRLGQEAAAFVRTRYSLDVIVRQEMALYRDLVE